jgi:hypothetical protein
MIDIYFHIDDVKHTAPKSWQDVTFDRFLAYFDKVAAHEPQILKDFIVAHGKVIGELSEALTDEQLNREAERLFMERWNRLWDKEQIECYNYFALDVAYWCGVTPEQIKEGLDKDTLFAAYWALQVQMNPDNAEVNEDYAGFELKGVEYLVPTKHMVGSTVEEFSDAAQFQEDMSHLKAGNWRSMLDVMTVLCRPKGELYNDDKLFRATRKNLFKALPMTDVVNVAFFLLKLNEQLKVNLVIYTAQQELARMQHRNLATATDGLQ